MYEASDLIGVWIARYKSTLTETVMRYQTTVEKKMLAELRQAVKTALQEYKKSKRGMGQNVENAAVRKQLPILWGYLNKERGLGDVMTFFEHNSNMIHGHINAGRAAAEVIIQYYLSSENKIPFHERKFMIETIHRYMGGGMYDRMDCGKFIPDTSYLTGPSMRSFLKSALDEVLKVLNQEHRELQEIVYPYYDLGKIREMLDPYASSDSALRDVYDDDLDIEKAGCRKTVGEVIAEEVSRYGAENPEQVTSMMAAFIQKKIAAKQQQFKARIAGLEGEVTPICAAGAGCTSSSSMLPAAHSLQPAWMPSAPPSTEVAAPNPFDDASCPGVLPVTASEKRVLDMPAIADGAAVTPSAPPAERIVVGSLNPFEDASLVEVVAAEDPQPTVRDETSVGPQERAALAFERLLAELPAPPATLPSQPVQEITVESHRTLVPG